MAEPMAILLGLYRSVSSQAENGVRLVIIMPVLTLYGRGRAIRLGVYIAQVLIKSIYSTK
jgi:hypothetical protein